MTTIVLNKGFSTAAAIVDYIAHFFVSLNKAIAMSRSVEANWQVAQQLQQTEYKNESVAEIAARLNERSRKDIYGD